jgi:NAD(P)-dependent dehydrogenase (short-subunit alcohol dehydrogenase family)
MGEACHNCGEPAQKETHVEKRSILITGGTSGIGKAAALGFAAAGWTVAICGRRADLLKAVSEEGKLALAEAVDVADADAVGRFFAAAMEKLGRIDVVFNNAGAFSASSSFGDIDVIEWHRMVDVNLNGAFHVAREAFRAMRGQSPQGGRIINNGSISAYAPRPGAAAYTATKHAITGLTKSISLDGRQFNIACGQIDIGNTATDMTATAAKGAAQADGSIKVEPRFDVKHVVDALLYMAGLPLDANVQFMTVMATAMPYVGRG